MTIHDSDDAPFTATVSPLPGGQFGLLTVTRTSSNPVAKKSLVRHAILNVVFDNSGSMGSSTRTGLEALVRPLLEQGWFTHTLVTLFDDRTACFQIDDLSSFEAMLSSLPRQGRTNITKGVADSMQRVSQFLSALPDGDEAHVLTMLLTDGAHNEGPAITSALAYEMNDKLSVSRSAAASKTLHTVLAFCLTDGSDASASMIVKEVFETAKMQSLPSVFYAKSHSEMSKSLTDVVSACGQLFDRKAGAVFAKMDVTTEYIALGSASTTCRFVPHEPVSFVVALPRVDRDPWLTADGVNVPVLPIPAEATTMAQALAALKDALEPLTRQAVAFSVDAIDRRLSVMESLVATIDEVAAEEKKKFSTRAASTRTPAERREFLKRVISTQYGLHELRNALAALRVRARSNSDKISLLTGNQRKFAHVASKRSGTENRTAQMILDDTLAQGAVIAKLIADDLKQLGSRGVDVETLLQPTAITLQNTAEVLAQWVDDEGARLGFRQTNDEAIMDVLSMYGVTAFPIRIATCDATQVDLMQLSVTDMCVQPADSASMMLSWRLNSPIKFGDGNTYTELLLLVDPAVPRASTHALGRTLLVQHLLSATVSKDLFMYLPGMHTSLHTHAFVTAVSKAVQLAKGTTTPPLHSFLRMATHIVYSARKLLENKIAFEEMDNFRRWILELSTVTRSQADQVFHCALLSIKFAISRIDIDQVNDSAAVLIQMNEQLCRKLALIHSTGGQFASPACFVQELFGIVASDAPHPDEDPLAPEPSESAVRMMCPKVLPAGHVDGVSGRAREALGLSDSDTLQSFVEAQWLPLFQLHQYSLALHEALHERGTDPDGFTAFVERHGCIPDNLVEAVQQIMHERGTTAESMWQFLGVPDSDVPNVCAAAIMQSCIYATSQDRVGVVNTKDVTDRVEQRDMVEHLYYLHYLVKRGFKAQQRLAIIGDVTAAQAASADAGMLADMIGVHTHGHCKNVFWGMLRGLLTDPNAHRREQKVQLFKAKSSQAGFDKVVRRARR